VDCTYLLLAADDEAGLRAAQAAGFRVVDVRVELDKPLAGRFAVPASVRPMTAADIEAVEHLCRVRFDDTRFATDPGFPRDRVRELYVAWLARARATPERMVLVADGGAGFVICRAEDGVGMIELIASRDSGRGTGTALVAAADAHFAAAGFERARVVTQARNVVALRLYTACGYRPCASGYWLHRWREGALSR